MSFGTTIRNYCIDHVSLYRQSLLLVAGFTLPLGATGCNPYASSMNEYLAIVKVSDGSIFKMKQLASMIGTANSLFTKILVDSKGNLSILGII